MAASMLDKNQFLCLLVSYHLNKIYAIMNFMQVALLNGITMGGGAGVSIPGTFRVATDKTV